MAVEYLENAGYRLLVRNFRHRAGEIDLVMEKGRYLVFVEVKTWDAFPEENLEYAITGMKIRKIIDTAKCFMAAEGCFDKMLIRFDLVFITENFTRIKHIKNAFSEV